MSTQRLTIEVFGLPAPQGSKRHVGNGRMVESSKKVQPWRQDVKHAALAALEQAPEWDRELALVAMHVTFSLPRPVSHHRTIRGQRTALLHEWAPALSGTKPDLDKLLRSTCDALTTAGVYADDARLCHIYATKAYVSSSALPVGVLDRPGAQIVLTPAGRP